MGFLLDPDDASKYPENEIYGTDVHYDDHIANNLYKADSMTDLLNTLALVPDIDKAVRIDITTKPEDW